MDAGALIAVERSHREVIALLKGELTAGRLPLTHGGVVGQVWRDGGARQALLARFLRAAVVVALDEALGRHAGALLAAAGGSDVIDAALVTLAQDGDLILTSDPDDLLGLSIARGVHVDIVNV